MLLILILLLIFSPALRADGPGVLVPVPKDLTVTKGCYTYQENPVVRTQIREKDFSSPEAYVLEVTPKGITIKAGGEAGAFYARHSIQG